MKLFNKIFAVFAIIAAVCSCENFDEVNTNPNTTSQGNAKMLATWCLRQIQLTPGIPDSGYKFLQGEMLGKAIAFLETASAAYQYNNLGRSDFNELSYLRNVNEMVAAAEGNLAYDSYVALSHFVRAYYFYAVTMRMGDIPYSEAGRGTEGIFDPKYDTQKEVFLGILNELETADELFSKGYSFDGDIFYDGDPAKWRKAVNSFELKVLMNLFEKSDADLRVKERVNNIVNNKPLFQSYEDNFQINYADKAGMKYPWNKSVCNHGAYELMSTMIVDKLKEYNDYRLFAYADMTPNAKAAGADPSDFSSYGGVDPYLDGSNMKKKSDEGNVSGTNMRYEELADVEPRAIFAYQENCLILAEAKIRGILTGGKSAAEYYNDAIRAAMEFTNAHTPAAYNHGCPITSDYIDEYIGSAAVAFKTGGTMQEQLSQIMWQKYIASFLQMPFSMFYENRRTGLPEIKVDPATNENDPTTLMPVRWRYPSSEIDYNTDNYNQAIQSQFSGVDDNNGIMWILKK